MADFQVSRTVRDDTIACSSRQDAEQKRYLLSADAVARASQGIAAYKKLWRGLCRISELNLTILKTGKGRLNRWPRGWRDDDTRGASPRFLGLRIPFEASLTRKITRLRLEGQHVSPIEWDNVVLYGQYVLNPKLVRRWRGSP